MLSLWLGANDMKVSLSEKEAALMLANHDRIQRGLSRVFRWAELSTAGKKQYLDRVRSEFLIKKRWKELKGYGNDME